MSEGVDYAFSNPRPAELRAAGKTFAMRYVGPGTSPKHLTVGEADALKAAGLSLVTLVEGAAGDARGGYQVGVAHARSAVAMLKARRFPIDRPMYFAIDYDVTTAGWPAAREYLRGAGSVIGAQLVGLYGGYDPMVWAARDGVARWFFQTYAWSEGRWFSGNHVEQYRNGVHLAGGVVDLCRSRKEDFGQWGQSGTGAPIAPQQEGRESMATVFLWKGNIWISRGDTELREIVCQMPAAGQTDGRANVVCDAHRVYPAKDSRGYPNEDLSGPRGWTEALVDLTFGPVKATVVDDPLTPAEVDAIAASVVEKVGQGFTQTVSLSLTGSGSAVTTAAPAGE